MSQSNETISIDLTEDDIGSQEQSQIQFANYNSKNMEKLASQKNGQSCSTPTLPPNTKLVEHVLLSKNNIGSPEMSDINFIESLQKENPQIETVFIESDEDDNLIQITPNLKTNDMHLKSTNEITGSGRATLSVNKTSNQALLPLEKNDNLQFKVRSISASCTQNLLKNSNTIALHDDNSQSKKYLVIPKEVAPLLARSQGPISLNVPGMGSLLLIQKPADILNLKSPPPLIKKYFQDPRHEKVLLKNTSNEPVYNPLSDSKYCWRYQKGRKRDLDGFSISDRLGFYKAEQHRTRMCAVKYNAIVKRLELSINTKKRALMAMKSTRLNMENIKLVEIDSIKKGEKNDLLQNKNINLKMSKSLAGTDESHKRHIVSPIELSSSESDSSTMDNDLLVTKKVVFINETEQRKGRKRKKRQWLNQHKKKIQKTDQYSQDPLQNKIVQQTKKDKDTTDILLNKKKGKQKEQVSNVYSISASEDTQNARGKKGIKCQYSKTRGSSSREHARGKPSEPTLMESDKDVSDYEIKPCHVQISPNNLMKKALKRFNKYTSTHIKNLKDSCKIIDSLKQFQHEIQPIKPLLVINEEHCAKMDFKDLFCKYNLVFPMSENNSFLNLKINNMLFVESAVAGYIKFVKPRILCKYLSGFREM